MLRRSFRSGQGTSRGAQGVVPRSSGGLFRDAQGVVPQYSGSRSAVHRGSFPGGGLLGGRSALFRGLFRDAQGSFRDPKGVVPQCFWAWAGQGLVDLVRATRAGLFLRFWAKMYVHLGVFEGADPEFGAVLGLGCVGPAGPGPGY